ncbi:cell division cycle 20.2, cofactor of APC complex [Selaginella moellendorffii]|nr:cell division cycle 20.2, cofactor of APC complex [Selaginella moellendorffii]|eukprot:XP_024530677.1 cell division cycle 20.2, cofactor of APC complex [Selaginella moellendorffii]
MEIPAEATPGATADPVEIPAEATPRSVQSLRRRTRLSPAPLSPLARRPSISMVASSSHIFHVIGDIQGDRFIPNRGAMDLDLAHFNLLHEARENSHTPSEVASPVKEDYRRILAESLLSCETGSPKILAFTKKIPSLSIQRCLDTELDILPSSKKPHRHICQTPERILDAPEIVDDYYLNLLDWSCNNTVAVALGPAVYLWDADTGESFQLSKCEEHDTVTSVAWSDDGRLIAVGLSSACIQLWHATSRSQIRTFRGHSSRVSSLAWNGSLLSSGSRDHKIINHDVRARAHKASVLAGHCQEVCGLKWSPCGQQLASGGNDNLLHIWDAAVASTFDSIHPGSRCAFRFDCHRAAVKALAWCPFQSRLLASGGGTVDRCIKFWNTQTGTCLSSIDTLSQVCALQWSRHQKEILSSHGYGLNQLCVWKYPSMIRIAELRGHTARVIHLAQSPEGTTVASAAADETLRFWRVFGSPNKKCGSDMKPSGLSRSASSIR